MRIPGKVMLLGEYAVLAGARATLWTFPSTAPGFRFLTDPAARPAFHPESPAGRVGPNVRGTFFRDLPWGGFGASTAEFIAAYHAIHPHATERQIWEAYRALPHKRGLPPSGADLAAQLAALRPEPQRFVEVQNGSVVGTADPAPVDAHLAVFSVPHRKVATHEHLAGLNDVSDWVQRLGPTLEQAHRAFQTGDLRNFGQQSTDYAEALAPLGLEHPEARSDRAWVLQQPGVWGAKGTGALLADAMAVWVDEPGRAHEIARRAASRGWHLVDPRPLQHFQEATAP